MHVECVVVAEQSRARLFIRDRVNKIFQEVEVMVNPEARLHDQELMQDRPGRSFDIKGDHRHAMEMKTNPSKQVAERFAKDICKQLKSRRNEYEKIILIAAPAFLGLLRDNLPDTLKKDVIREIDKDIVRKDEKEIEAYIRELPE